MLKSLCLQFPERAEATLHEWYSSFRDIVCILQDHYCWLTEYSQLCLKSKLMEKSQKVLSKTLAGFSGASSSTEENDKSNQKLQAVWGLNQRPERSVQDGRIGFNVCMRTWQFLQMASCIPQRQNHRLKAHWQIPEHPEVVQRHTHIVAGLWWEKTLFYFFSTLVGLLFWKDEDECCSWCVSCCLKNY